LNSTNTPEPIEDLIISAKTLEQLRITPSELLIEFAVHLYDTAKLSMGQAKKLTGLTQVDFQKELAKHGVYVKYDIEDLEQI